MKRAMYKTIVQEKLSAYLKASLPQKTNIINSVCAVSGMRRKSVIRAFRREQNRSGCKPVVKLGRPKYYVAETEAALAWVWEQYEYPCAERLKNEIPEIIRIFVRDGMWDYGEQATEQLWNMSLAAMKVRCIKLSKDHGLIRGLSTTCSGVNLPFLRTPCVSYF